MSSLFEKVGYRVGRAMGKGGAVLKSLAGDEAESLEAEVLLGRDMARELVRQLQVLDDPELSAFVQQLGSQLTAKLANKRIPFAFTVVAGGTPNAFALPGGPVFVTGSLLQLCGNAPDEVAFVLAHEVAHIIRRHPLDRLLANSLFSSLARALPLQNAVGRWMQQTGVKFLSSAYSQDNELEADEFSVALCRAAGFRPEGGALLLGRLQQLRQSGGGIIGEYFGSHPPLKDRIARIKARCA